MEGRTTVMSTIKFRPTARDNSATYACEAQHPALHSSIMRVSVVLSVMCKFDLMHILNLGFPSSFQPHSESLAKMMM